MSVNGRITRLEKHLQAMTWQEEIEHLVKQGKATALDVLHELGTFALETWPEWYREHDQAEVNQLAEAASERNRAILARYSEAEIQAMLDGRMPWPEDW